MEKKENKKENKNNIKEKFTHHLYIENNIRVIVLILLFIFIIILFFGYYALIKNFNNKSYNTFAEISNVNYQVLTNDGVVYTNKQTNNYYSNLINKMDVDLTYKFSSLKNYNGSIDYKIKGTLKILDQNNKNVYTKDYDLLTNQEIYINNENNFSINKTITFDYAYYYYLANGLITSTYSGCTPVFEVSLVVDNEYFDSKVESIDTNKLILSIPLNTGIISVAGKTVDNVDKFTSIEKGSFIELVIIMVVLVLVIVVFAIFLIYTIKEFNNEKDLNDYEKKIRKILYTYDKLIVNVSVMPDLDDYKVSNVNEFKELHDAAKLFNEPIRYIEVTKNKKSNFIVRHKDELFIYTITNKK